MDKLPMELLSNMFIRVGDVDLYKLLLTSTWCFDVIENEMFWQEQCKAYGVKLITGYDWRSTYLFWLKRCMFTHDTSRTVWKNAKQAIKTAWGPRDETTIVYEVDDNIREYRHRMNVRELFYYEPPRPSYNTNTGGYNLTEKVGDVLHTVCYAPYGSINFACELPTGEVLRGDSAMFTGEIKHENIPAYDRLTGRKPEVFRLYGIVVFDCGFVMTHDLDDLVVFNNGRYGAVPGLSPETIKYLRNCMDQWITWCDDVGYADYCKKI